MPPAFEFARCRRRAPHWLAGQAIGSGSKREIDDINPHTWLTQSSHPVKAAGTGVSRLPV
jgi:hypothetical protein